MKNYMPRIMNYSKIFPITRPQERDDFALVSSDVLACPNEMDEWSDFMLSVYVRDNVSNILNSMATR
jgi:hypothetical protein